MTQKIFPALLIAGLTVSCVALAQGAAGGAGTGGAGPGSAGAAGSGGSTMENPTTRTPDSGGGENNVYGGANTTGTNTTTTTAQSLDKDSIMQAQQALGVTADGIAGPQTEKSVRQFQSDHGLAQTGVLDQDTVKALNIGATPGEQSPSNP